MLYSVQGKPQACKGYLQLLFKDLHNEMSFCNIISSYLIFLEERELDLNNQILLREGTPSVITLIKVIVTH